MAQYFSILTEYGTQAFAKALANNQPLKLAQFAVGDGNGQAVTPTANRAALARETYRANVSAVSLDPRNNKQVIVELTIPENIGGFYIREMGVFDNQNKLIAYANSPESYKPTEGSGSGKVQVLRMILKIASSNAVTLSIDNSVIFATRQQLAPKTITATTKNGFDETGHSHEIERASISQAGIVQLTDDTGLDSDKLGLTARAGKKLAQWIANLQLALNNYIPNSKKSSRVDSNSAEDVATSAAVKIAYDKAVDAKNVADNAVAIENDTTYQNSRIRIGWLKTSPYGAYLLVDSTNQGKIITDNYLSPLVNSNNNQLPASVAGVKIAYDKGAEAKSAADAAQNTANSAVTKADNAQRAADNANNNANNRVAKSGDTMTGALTIENNEPRVYGKKAGAHKWFIGLPNANTDYPRFHNYTNDTWMELNSGNIIVNKPLYLGNNPLPSSLNEHRVQFGWNNNALELKVDNSELGYLHTSIKAYVETNVVDNNYSGLNIIRKGTSGNFWARFEALPDKRWKFSTENGSTIHLKNQNGNILLDSDISHALNGNNKEKVASEFALGDLNKKKANLSDFSYQKIGNFEIRKYPDGTMIQTYFVEQYDIRDFKEKSFNWAQSFVGMPLIFADAFSSVNDTHLCGASIRKKSTNATCYYWDYEIGGINQGDIRVQFLAIGRWK